jgi:hypothetical protein
VQWQRALDYGLTGMAQVAGWLSPLDVAVFTSLLVAQTTASIEGDLAEIGVWQGKSAILLSHFVDTGETLYAVDVFDLYYPGEVPSSPTKPYANPATFSENLRTHGCPPAVTPIASDTRRDDSLVAKLSGRGVRFFHIDGGHSYDHVVADCATALAVVAESSVVVLDDFMQIDNPPVTEAIIDTFRSAPNGLVPFATTRKKLYLASRHAVQAYWRHLTALLPGAITRKRPILGASAFILNPARFDLSRDFRVPHVQSADTSDDVRRWVDEESSRFPRMEDWLDERAVSLNA